MIGDLCFSVSHWALANYFFKIARNGPKIVKGEGEVQTYKCMFWSGIVPNVVFPILEGIFLAILNYELGTRENDEVSTSVEYVLNGATICVVVSQIFSGLVLIWSIWSIRGFLKS